jgi:hypothetical protein
MPSKDTLLCLDYKHDIRGFARLSETSKRVVLALLTDETYHLSVHRGPQDHEMHVEYSSGNPIGSVWDGARIGIAEKLGYRQPERHACYLVNCTLTGLSEINTPIVSQQWSFDSFSRTMPSRHARLPRICLPLNAKSFWLSLYFEPSNPAMISAECMMLPTALGKLFLRIST